ncbi:DNA repair protein RecN [Comamonas flocculans]|uniref:DNA repair protein RecN n=1 Tax=Comamonas flocculans TaxID=2597701 RepID=A0A5B8RYS2_9BURK|nr:DNA repair protein RecN [Comamonas flocculans]QEA13924.1 DNA repair protein RecN [Comamonas flocculans]
MALRRIALRDFVIVRELDLDVHAGFTVLTGETGAGKSILIDALQLLLGARADTALVREGAERAEVSAEFDALPAALLPWLDEAGIPHDDGLLLRRSVDAQGRSRAWINAVPATATQMRTLGEWLIDIHGQHAWQSLTRADAMRALLDAYAGADTREVARTWSAWRAAHAALAQALSAQDSLQQERERLQWQIAELEKLAPLEGEWSELDAEHTRLANAQALLASARQALDALQPDEGRGALGQLAGALQALQEQLAVEPQFEPPCTALTSCLAEAEDAAHSLHGYLRHSEPDPARLEQLQERLSLWLQLARRYRRTPEELPALLAGWRAALHSLDEASDLQRLQAAEQQQRQAYDKAAQLLSRARRKAATPLAAAITQAMQGLGMTGGRFVVEVSAASEPATHGIDQVQFLVASHPGMTPRAVGKVASGGELSRIALAIAVTTSALGEVPTLIFDEIDSGVGGAVAETVGRLMRRLGRDRQVLAVTHLPQVAACGDQHWLVAKHSTRTQTSSSVAALSGQQRTREIARMLGGEHLSATTLAHAGEMLAGAGEA